MMYLKKVRTVHNILPPYGQVLCILCKTFHSIIACSVVKLFEGWRSRTAEELQHWVVEGGMLKQVTILKQSTYPTFKDGHTCPSCFPAIAKLSRERVRNDDGEMQGFFVAEVIRTPTTRSREAQQEVWEKEGSRILKQGRGIDIILKRRV